MRRGDKQRCSDDGGLSPVVGMGIDSQLAPGCSTVYPKKGLKEYFGTGERCLAVFEGTSWLCEMVIGSETGLELLSRIFQRVLP